MSETPLTVEQASELVGDDIAYWLHNPFMSDDMVADKVAWWVGRAVAAARADERRWFKDALTSDLGDLLDIHWLRENWWVKHVVAAHLDGPPDTLAQPATTDGADQ